MTRKTRLIILLVCIVCFFVVAPILVLYSVGYRFDFQRMKLTETGGIYVRSFPAAGKIIIDSKIIKTPGIFSNSIFIQSLLPSSHTVLVEKNGYNNYFKTIPVQEEQVTKLENILLIKKNIQLETVTDKTPSPFSDQSKFIIKNNNLYYSDNLVNSALLAIQKSTPIIKKIVSFAIQNNNIIWIKTDGFVYESDPNNLTAEPIKITTTPIKIIKAGTYDIIADNNNIFIDNNGELSLLDIKTGLLDVLSESVKDAKISPDGKDIIYYNSNNLYLSPLPNMPEKKTVLYKSTEKITDCTWLDNDYIIFVSGNKIIISEIDYRGNINAVTLPQAYKNPKISFNQQDGKLYILTSDTLLSSDKITP